MDVEDLMIKERERIVAEAQNIERWTRIHADLMDKLGLPCRLEFVTGKVKYGREVLGQHVWTPVGDYGDTSIRTCHININPEVNWRVPEHLILHEAAHHRADLYDEWHGHSEHWAKILFNMYEETGVVLPQSTAFVEFAKIAGIEHRIFKPEATHPPEGAEK
jgi:hypothetical protein